MLPALIVAVMALAAPGAPAVAEEPHWDYHSHGGAAAWGELTIEGSGERAFPACSYSEQSPVDIPAGAPVEDGLALDYAPTPVQVTNNGHTIQVNHVAGSTMTFGGKTYRLLQFHFHSPSEHKIAGRQALLEAHFVHRADDGEYAVLGVLIVPGEANAALRAVLDVTPAEVGEASGAGTLDAADLLPESPAHYAYDGSFTTPPCTEGVRWFVLSETVEASLFQIAEFRALGFLRHEGEFTGNARPVQALNGRLGADAEPGGAPAIVPPSTGSGGLASP